MWGLPNEIVEAVTYHHQPLKQSHIEMNLVAIIYIAEVFYEASSDELDAEFFALINGKAKPSQWQQLVEAVEELWQQSMKKSMSYRWMMK